MNSDKFSGINNVCHHFISDEPESFGQQLNNKGIRFGIQGVITNGHWQLMLGEPPQFVIDEIDIHSISLLK
jgi:hypothetical protein